MRAYAGATGASYSLSGRTSYLKIQDLVKPLSGEIRV